MKRNLLSLLPRLAVCVIASLLAISFETASAIEVVQEPSYEAEAQRLAEGIAEMETLPDKKEDGSLPENVGTTRATNMYPTRKGIILVTDVKVSGVVPTGHAAIVYSQDYCVESVAEGVVLGRNNWYSQYKNCAAAAVKGTTFAQDEAVGNWCYRQIGKPYNWSYYDISRRDAFYCAQLVWAGYKDLCGIDLNTSEAGTAIHPLELLWSPNTYKVYGKGSLA